ncbi:type II restriction enzyme Sau3AI, GATC site [Clostridium polyendosporum]|uniref:Type II restriction enzyme Sau3AI, GATC site n=1 Tax=Clostridium polyendosporum TaxID=69208 RepID=A0A919S113_9CLOT|nr:Sau3AI family type II restriction endonuclease [Clostridium polyendosporum]GIM29842.1 type II restriction enzyme Sau3AI, GATC site [Clostridium polyendosporum]
MKFKSENHLLEFTKDIVGKTFGELDKLGLLFKSSNDKGVLGKIVETGFYGYQLNNNAEADFSSLGIELKVTGFKVNKNKTLSAKERLSLSMINYYDIINETFEFSKLLFKNKKLLIIWYQYEENKSYADFTIKYYQIYNMTEDEKVFKNDFLLIKNKVLSGQAHLLSEGDTSYLGACTKGSKGQKSKQPYSGIPASSRAYCLKNSYMTGILRNFLTSSNYTPVDFSTVDEYILNKLTPYIGLTQLEIYNQVSNSSITKIPKQLGKMISDRTIGQDNELQTKHDLFCKTTYIIKNIPVDEYNYPLERLSFRNLILSEFDREWDESDWKNYFQEVTIILICYEGKGKKNGYRVLKGIKKLTFSSDDIDLFEKSYSMVREAIKNNDISELPYPKKFTKPTLVIAPKGNAGDDAYNNFFKSDTTRTCFMLDKDFIYNKIK